MKNARIHSLILLTCIFAAFTVGLFCGRNVNRIPVQVQRLPDATVAKELTVETAPTVPAIININTATSEQLQTLPAIGPVLAERIIAYRSTHGAFESVGELMNVSGIAEKTLETIWDLVTIGG